MWINCRWNSSIYYNSIRFDFYYFIIKYLFIY